MKKLLTLLLVAVTTIACGDNNTAESVPGYVAGVNYRTLANPISTNSEKIEVREFFAYGCPHCQSFEKPLHHWRQTMATDVNLVQSPAVWNDLMKLHAQVFFIIQSMPNKAEVHAALFAEVMELRGVSDVNAQTDKLATFLAGYGLSRSEFERQLASAEVKKSTAQAMQLMSRAKVEGTPTIVINGRYAVINRSAKSFEEILEITNFLIDKERVRLAQH